MTQTPAETQPQDDESTIQEGMLLDYITGKPKKENPKELVRQRIARALFHEYGISPDDIKPDYSIATEVDGKTRRKRVSLAVFHPGAEHSDENLGRVVVCQAEPKNGKKGAFKMRDHTQAEKDLQELKNFMTAVPSCQWGLWTNGLEFFFLQREEARFETRFKPIGDWPPSGETEGTKDLVSDARLRKADPDMLRVAFRRCHNFIHGNEGMPKDAAFWQFLYLIFAKMHDERGRGVERRFWASPTEQFDEDGPEAIRARITPLFDEVKREYSSIFRGNEEITLSDRALAFMVSELAKYDFGRTDVDAKGAAYQEIVGANLRGDRGQYFTPRGAIKLMVAMLDPQPEDRIIDPSCGTGGFLVSTISHILESLRARREQDAETESTGEFLSVLDELGSFVKDRLFGADFDQFLVRASQMNVVMASNTLANLFHMNSLEFPNGSLDGVGPAGSKARLGTMDMVLTNPPFGSDIPITDRNILKHFELARIWKPIGGGAFRDTGREQGSVSPEILFIERCVQWLKPGGRMGIVLPDGILGNPGDAYIRAWILRHCYVLASV
ncbi:MAG: restriction endonuclease subunit M, partial [Victivallales bacterium]|nr:restriction endonuclease subunit M [Victivallales bacterium]